MRCRDIDMWVSLVKVVETKMVQAGAVVPVPVQTGWSSSFLCSSQALLLFRIASFKL